MRELRGVPGEGLRRVPVRDSSALGTAFYFVVFVRLIYLVVVESLAVF